MTAASSFTPRVDELELDVVGIAEHQRRERRRPLDVADTRVGDAQLVELGRPGVEVRAAGHSEADVIEAGPTLVERLAVVGLVMVQADEQT